MSPDSRRLPEGERRTGERLAGLDERTTTTTDPAPSRADVARAHVAAVVERYPEAAGFDEDAWVAAVLTHWSPLPANRAWRVLAARHRLSPVAQLAPAVARRLTPAEGHRPQPTCPAYCAAAHREVA